MSRLVLTLVHGTWGRGMFRPSGDAPWTKDESAFCSSLRTRFGDRVVFRRFPWSGGNSHTARSRAAEDLREYLDEGLQEWPDHTHVIVAHSHGGNVALSALNAFNSRDKIAGIACLATPFISARERDLGKDPSKIMVAAGTTFSFAMMWEIQKLFPSWSMLDYYTVLGVIFLLCILLVYVLKALRPSAIEVLDDVLEKGPTHYAKNLRDELTSLPPQRSQFLIIRSPADEASGALAVFQFISQITMRVFLLTQMGHARLEGLASSWGERTRTIGNIFLWTVGLLFVLALLPSFTPDTSDIWSGGEDEGWLHSTSVVVNVVMLAALFLMIPWIGTILSSFWFGVMVGGFAWVMITTLSILLLVPFGWQAAVANFLLDISVEPTPVGLWETHLVVPPTSEELGRSVPPLHHMVYENPRALQILGEWIEKIMV